MTLSKADKLKRCADCDNNFYNQGNNSSSGECWMLADAESQEVFVVGTWTEYPDKHSYSIGKRLTCWTPRRGSGITRWKAPVK